MGAIFKKIKDHLPPNTTGVFVEIGSDRYEGSTAELDHQAAQLGTYLISVDLLDQAKQRLENKLHNTKFVVAVGNTWAKQYLGPPIACLYLDNFDYFWDVLNTQYNQDQITMYADMGITMSNENCQIEHLQQMIALYPHLTDDAVVTFDDTYKVNDCWIGKCGPAVVYLLAHDFKIVEQITNDGCGVILKKLDIASKNIV